MVVEVGRAEFVEKVASEVGGSEACVDVDVVEDHPNTWRRTDCSHEAGDSNIHHPIAEAVASDGQDEGYDVGEDEPSDVGAGVAEAHWHSYAGSQPDVGHHSCSDRVK